MENAKLWCLEHGSQSLRWGPPFLEKFMWWPSCSLWTFDWWAPVSWCFFAALGFSILCLAVFFWICVAFCRLRVVTMKSQCSVCRRHASKGSLSLCAWKYIMPNVSASLATERSWFCTGKRFYGVVLVCYSLLLQNPQGLVLYEKKRERDLLTHSSGSSRASVCFHEGPCGRWHHNSGVQMRNWQLMGSPRPRIGI